MPLFYINMLKASSYKVTHCIVVADFAVFPAEGLEMSALEV